MVFHNIMMMGAAHPYKIEYSVDVAGGYLQRNPGTGTNRKTHTWAFWIRYDSPSADNQTIICQNSGIAGGGGACYSSGSKIRHYNAIAGAGTEYVVESPDLIPASTTAWYHYVYQVDTTQGTSANRCKIYVNGSLCSNITNGNYSLNDDLNIMNNENNRFFQNTSGSYAFTGYIADFIFIDGLALGPESFGEDDGGWKPTDPSGLTFGSNGFWLPFSNSSDLGEDFSGNNNDWTKSGTLTRSTLVPS
jgi:hypothetical protein